MSGHSKWSTIKRHKGAVDAKRSKIFTKLIREITVAAKLGGSGIDGNPRLRLAVDKAKAQSMPKDSIERAIKKGAGELEGTHYEEITYEGYGPVGVAILVDCMTDNKVRAVAEVRNAFSKHGGHMGESHSVAWMFEKKGILYVAAAGVSEDSLFEKAIEAGAEDIRHDTDQFIVTTGFTDFMSVKDKLEKQGVMIKESGLEMVPKNMVSIATAQDAQKVLGLIEALEDNDDVQNVWANFDISEEMMGTL